MTGPDGSAAFSLSGALSKANKPKSKSRKELHPHARAKSLLCVQLLQELCTVFNVDLPCRVKSSQLGIISNQQRGGGGAIVTPQPSSCSYICQHCLVHLGDIGEDAPPLSSERRPQVSSP